MICKEGQLKKLTHACMIIITQPGADYKEKLTNALNSIDFARARCTLCLSLSAASYEI